VVFAILWGKTPVGLKHPDTKGLKKHAPALQRVAWDTVTAWWRASESDQKSLANAASSVSAPPPDREALIAEIFSCLDIDGDGCLNSSEFWPFEEFMGFQGNADRYADEFAILCEELQCCIQAGIELSSFTRLVDGGTEAGLTCTDCSDADLQELHTKLDKKAPKQGACTRVAIVPGNGCGSVWRSNWYGWLASELRQRGVEVGIRDMPDPVVARESVWLPFIVKELAGGEAQLAQTIVVGHSSGAAAAMRLAEKHRVGGVVLVSAYTSDLGDRNEKKSGYFARPWKWEQQRSNCGFLAQFASTDDPFLPMSEQRAVRDGLAPEVEYIELDGRSHFFDAPFPELLELVLRRLGS